MIQFTVEQEHPQFCLEKDSIEMTAERAVVVADGTGLDSILSDQADILAAQEELIGG